MKNLLIWIIRVNLTAAFLLLLGGHALMYSYLGTDDWFMVAILAAAVETAALAFAQFLIRLSTKQGQR